ncbi:hypothetical protein Zm00014a_024574 [Zea mays]|uniref:Uncharacterized protein n=1 Tax=Zea mays TaxID=4577 RepID=A0A3L6GCH3_MAIZE|nr:hypothetical protein Zm00014a_024574 [Zea mays]
MIASAIGPRRSPPPARLLPTCGCTDHPGRDRAARRSNSDDRPAMSYQAPPPGTAAYPPPGTAYPPPGQQAYPPPAYDAPPPMAAGGYPPPQPQDSKGSNDGFLKGW